MCEYEPTPIEITQAEIPVITKMIADECWYEGERRGYAISPSDPVIKHKINELIIQNGAIIRKETIFLLKTIKSS